MLAHNNTPFAAFGFEKVHRDGPPMAVIAVRASFNLFADGRLLPFDRHELVLADTFEADPQKSTMLRVGDLIGFRPGTDITVIGKTYAPEGKSAAQWNFGVGINDQMHLLRAHGLRDWIPDGTRNGKPH